jgi:hypothetical protein
LVSDKGYAGCIFLTVCHNNKNHSQEERHTIYAEAAQPEQLARMTALPG